MSEKVTLPKEVAEALTTMKREISSNIKIIDIVTNADDYGMVIENKELGNAPYTLRAYTREYSDNFLSALVNGYDIEKTPEDRVREYYEKEGWGNAASAGLKLKQKVMRETLDLLDIQIPGVNCEEEKE